MRPKKIILLELPYTELPDYYYSRLASCVLAGGHLISLLRESQCDCKL